MKFEMSVCHSLSLCLFIALFSDIFFFGWVWGHEDRCGSKSIVFGLIDCSLAGILELMWITSLVACWGILTFMMKLSGIMPKHLSAELWINKVN